MLTASSRLGIASSMSMNRIRVVSIHRPHRPPRPAAAPETPPISAPMARPINVDTTPTSRVCRAPTIIRLNSSRPWWS